MNVTRKSLQRSETGSPQLLECLFEEAPDAIVVWDAKERIILVNRRAREMFGYESRELEGEPLELLLPDRPQATDQAETGRFSSQLCQRTTTVVTARHREGPELPAEVTLTALGADGDNLTVGCIRDVSRRRDLDRAVRQDEGHLRSLMDIAGVIPWEADARTWEFQYVGPQAVKILGYPVEDWYEPKFWADHVHPEDREYAIRLCRSCSAEMEDYQFEYRMIAADGRAVWLHDLVSVELAAGRPRILRGFMVDITSRKEAQLRIETNEAQLRAITDSVPVLISYIDKDERYRFNNRAYEEFIGVSARELDGRRIRDVLGQRYEVVQPRIQAALRGERVEIVTEADHPELGVRHFETVLVPHVSEEGVVEGFYALGIDTTEKMQQQEELRRRQDELAHVSRVSTMGGFAASLAHELSQPLGAILTNARAAQEFLGWEGEELDQNQREVLEALESIKQDTRRTGEIITRLRALLRKGELRKRPVHINDLIRAVETLGGGYAREMHTRLETKLESGLPRVSGDFVQLEQVLLNLFRNAVEALQEIPVERRRVVIGSRRDGADAVVVEVRDNGSGIPEALLQRVFEPFFTTKATGLGMGLSISRSIIDAHGGRLWAEPGPEGGLTVSISLPSGRTDGARSRR